MLPNVLQNPLLEYVLEFLFKQIVQHGPEIAREIRRQATHVRIKPNHVPQVELVNRESERRAIQTALEDDPHLRILYFVGEGGAGKTRLLREAQNFIQNNGKSPKALRWAGLLDFYHTELHSVTAVQGALIQGLDPAGEYFQNFRKSQERFERSLAEGLVGSAIEAERRKLSDLFLEEYHFFAQNHRPVIAFDTIESLAHESDWVESLCSLEDTPIASREWLIGQIGKLENSVILLAGRPQPSFQRALEKANHRSPGQLEIIELKGLTREDSHQLLALLLNKAPASLHPLMNDADQLWKITRGLPVQLALALELASTGQTIDRMGMGNSAGDEAWEQRLINELFSMDDSIRRIFLLLGLARKGMTIDLLRYLEPGLSVTDCERQLGQLRSASIVKTRPDTDELFLHDALYELFDLYPPPLNHLAPWYERLTDYYRTRYLRFEQNDRLRSQTAVSLLYYELQRDPRYAFESVYLRLREQALKGYELDYEQQLRDELLRFSQNSSYVNHPFLTQKLTHAEIDRDGVVRWIKRYLIRSNYQEALRVARTILSKSKFNSYLDSSIHKVPPLYREETEYIFEIFDSPDPLFWGQLLTCYSEALIYTSAPEPQVYEILEYTLSLLEDTQLEQNNLLTWLHERTLGRANDRLGYLFRTNGHYGSAITAYQKALPEYRNVDIADEASATLNNLAFTLAILGDFEQAKINIDQALVLRQQFGQKYPLALSHNTRGIIYSLQGQHESGQRESQLALNIFEELESPRGIGLACNALGYIFRKQGEGWKSAQSTPSEAIFCFQQSIKHLERAEKVFSDEVSEPIRLWESLNEQGSLYREWGLLERGQQEVEKTQELYGKAVECQLKALEIAKKYRMRFQEADAYDDLAKVLWDQGNAKKAQRWLKQALSLVPKEYSASSNRKSKKSPPAGEAYWLILGKVYLQEGVWAIKSLTQERLSKRKHSEYTQSAIHKFALASHFFERYWPGASANQSRFQFMAEQVLQMEMPIREIKRAVKLEGTRHKINVSAFLKTFPSRSVKR